MPRVLFIAHYFPPLGGAGVQRTVKFVKYLPEAGFVPGVVTGSGNESGRWSPSDDSMLEEIPPSVKVFRTSDSLRSSSRSHTLEELSADAALEFGADLILVSMSPFQDAQVARSVSRRLRIPWVADLRDPWALDEFQVYRSSLHRLAEKRKMASALSTAALIVMNTPEAAARLKKLPGFHRKKIISVTNGYDAQDFQNPIPTTPASTFKIVHAGYLHTDAGLRQRRHALQYRLLGRTESGVEMLTRSHFYLLRALERWCAEDPAIRERVSVVLAGDPSATDIEVVQQSPIRSLVQFTGYVSHAQSVQLIRTADLLFLPMHKMPYGRRATIVPGKTYEYMATGVPVLAALPEGDAKDFLINARTGHFCEPDDVTAMTAILKARYQEWATGNGLPDRNAAFIERFERRKLTQRLAAELLNI